MRLGSTVASDYTMTLTSTQSNHQHPLILPSFSPHKTHPLAPGKKGTPHSPENTHDTLQTSDTNGTLYVTQSEKKT